MKNTLLFILLFIVTSVSAQVDTKNLKGKWIETRREAESGYVYDRDLNFINPSIELDLNNKLVFKIIDDIIYENSTQYKIISLDKKNLVVTHTIKDSLNNSINYKSYFMRDINYKFLSFKDIQSLKSPNEYDLRYKDSVIQEKLILSGEDTVVHIKADEKPKFPGGESEYFAFARKNFFFPSNKVIDGRIAVSFIIEKDGTVSNIKILHSLGREYDLQVKRFIGIMPKWEPAKNNNVPIRVRAIVPLRLFISR